MTGGDEALPKLIWDFLFNKCDSLLPYFAACRISSQKLMFKKYVITSPPQEWREVLRSACLSVCLVVSLSVHLHTVSQKPHVQAKSFTKFRVYLLSAVVSWSSSEDSAIHYVLPVLWMTLCLHIMTMPWQRPVSDRRKRVRSVMHDQMLYHMVKIW